MLRGWFESFLSKVNAENDGMPPSSSTTPPSPESPVSSTQRIGFSTQKDIGGGQCKPLANAYAREQIAREGTPDFLATNEAAHMASLQEAKRQAELEQMGDDSRHSALIDSGKRHYHKDVPVSDLTDADQLSTVLGTEVKHALISYPTPSTNPGDETSAHQLYFGRRSDGKNCALFNADLTGGQVVGDCHDIQRYLASVIRETAEQPSNRHAIIGYLKQ